MSFSNAESTSMAFQVGMEANAYAESVGRMSSGKRQVAPSADLGAFSMHSKIDSASARHRLAMQNMLGAVSRSQAQMGLLKEGMRMIERMSVLATKAMDTTLNASDRENHDKEFQEVLSQYQKIFREKINNMPLFGISEKCGSQTIQVSASQSGEANEHVFEVDTVTGAGKVHFDQFAFAIPDLFQVYHGDVLIHERVTGAPFMSSFVGGLHSANTADVSEYAGNGYTPEPFQDLGEDGLAATGDTGEGNGTYDVGEPFTDQASGTRNGAPILNGNYDGYGPQQAAYLAAQFWAGSEPGNPSPGNQPGTRSFFKFGPDGRDVNGNPYTTDSTKLRFVVNQGGATASNVDLSPNATEWEYQIEIFPEPPENKALTLMTDGHGSEVTLDSVDMAMIYEANVKSVDSARSALDSLKKATSCAMHALSQASANNQRMQGEIVENEERIVSEESAASKIGDLDVAVESTKLAVAKMRYESVSRMLKNAQIIPQAILSLLR